MVANTGWHNILESTIDAEAGDVLRVTSYLNAAHPGDVDAGIHCMSNISISYDSAGALVAVSSTTRKYVTLNLEVLPLRNEFLATLPEDATYRLRLRLECVREGFSPTLTILGGRTMLFADRYAIH